jgi:hypothetical protein
MLAERRIPSAKVRQCVSSIRRGEVIRDGLVPIPFLWWCALIHSEMLPQCGELDEVAALVHVRHFMAPFEFFSEKFVGGVVRASAFFSGARSLGG